MTIALPVPAARAQDPVEDLLRLHHQQRVAHLLGDEALLAGHFADPLTEVGRGGVRAISADGARARFGAYFDAVRFLEWEDVRPPRVRLSDDGAWAEIVVEKRVRTIPAVGAAAAESSRQFAWVERWARTDAGWRLHTMASTDRPVEDDPPVDAAARVRAYEILERAREAVGGAGAVARVATLGFVAECQGPNGPFVTEVSSARDGRVSFVQRLGLGTVAAGIDLAGPWSGAAGEDRDSLRAVEATVVAAHELHLLAIAPEARYSAPTALPNDQVDGRVVDVVSLTDALGARVPFYFDAGTGVPVGFRPANHSRRGSADILTLFDDWRPVGDVQLPHTVRIIHGDDVYRYRIVEATTEWLEDGAFRPSELRPDRR